MNPEIPEALMIGPHCYEVRTDDRTLRDLRSDSDTGRCRPDDLTIDVDPDHPLTIIAETLLHEALHACIAQAGLIGVLAECEDELEERIVLTVSPVLLDALRSNPELVAFLTGPAGGYR